jgi:hypothetical protein
MNLHPPLDRERAKESCAMSRPWGYCCHEGNYAMGNILRGARLLEAEAREKR